MDTASHVNDADDNVDAADDDVYAGYVFIAVTAGSNFLQPTRAPFTHRPFAFCVCVCVFVSGQRPSLRMRYIQ